MRSESGYGDGIAHQVVVRQTVREHLGDRDPPVDIERVGGSALVDAPVLELGERDLARHVRDGLVAERSEASSQPVAIAVPDQQVRVEPWPPVGRRIEREREVGALEEQRRNVGGCQRREHPPQFALAEHRQSRFGRDRRPHRGEDFPIPPRGGAGVGEQRQHPVRVS